MKYYIIRLSLNLTRLVLFDSTTRGGGLRMKQKKVTKNNITVAILLFKTTSKLNSLTLEILLFKATSELISLILEILLFKATSELISLTLKNFTI